MLLWDQLDDQRTISSAAASMRLHFGVIVTTSFVLWTKDRTTSILNADGCQMRVVHLGWQEEFDKLNQGTSDALPWFEQNGEDSLPITEEKEEIMEESPTPFFADPREDKESASAFANMRETAEWFYAHLPEFLEDRAVAGQFIAISTITKKIVAKGATREGLLEKLRKRECEIIPGARFIAHVMPPDKQSGISPALGTRELLTPTTC